ncbi:sigma-70 family RNA polymerase sigma factor, partial [Planctomycetota bacterium]|nr:sigma-70 family RNA polymerase sigma factor [Planctomycetota bacterium]
MQSRTGAHPLSSDADLVSAFRDGDEAAFGQLIERHWGPCNRVALAVLHDPSAADDAAQEAFTALLDAVAKGDAPERVGAWLRGVTLNRARMQRRAAGRRTKREEAVGRARGEAAAPGEDAFARLHELTSHLPEDLRVPLELHYGLGCTHAEVAEMVGCPAGTASSRIRRGLERVR